MRGGIGWWWLGEPCAFHEAVGWVLGEVRFGPVEIGEDGAIDVEGMRRQFSRGPRGALTLFS